MLNGIDILDDASCVTHLMDKGSLVGPLFSDLNPCRFYAYLYTV